MRKIIAVVVSTLLMAALSGCSSGTEGKTTAIAAVLNGSVQSEGPVSESNLALTYHNNFILGPSIDISGEVTYSGIYADDLEGSLKSTIENIADTSSKVAKVDRGTITITGIAGSKKITSSVAYYGEEDKDVKIQKVLKDLEDK